ncbi:MAG TPA: NADH-quinone oxidoreductase subunit L [Candidatus Binatia bacterium]|nr:NADH-quinone oxidoreductase subunit L [Candidatus Binatia bacterium]
MVTATDWLRWIVLLPAAGFLFQVTAGRRWRAGVALVGPGVVLGAFAVAVAAALRLHALGPDVVLFDRCYTWLDAGGFRADATLRFDALSMVMTLVVTGVGFLIHVYSLGYMHDDPDFARFFAYLNLFVTAMLILVLADDLVLLFVGWEGVGLCSYLLIGFWYAKEENAVAGKKAFLANRVGDAGFLVGLFLLARTTGTLAVGGIEQHLPILRAATVGGWPLPLVACLCLLLGATGKSAQIPLYVWLPDAMAGPTPVSALIHAATMVTAGVYMMARLHALFALAPAALAVVAGIGAATAFFAATIAFAQTDIKKVLAYSTISQLGYMFLGIGVGAAGAAVFHVVTHAFFKALLFLGAGSVIHALGGEQDMRRMGGLRARLPVTFWTMTVATLAIAGVPPFAGFFSKDAILWAAVAGAHAAPVAAAVGYATAGMTAFYMGRLLFLTFLGPCRASPEAQHHLHESPATMALPLVVLAALAAVGGFLPVPRVLEPVVGAEGPEAPLGMDVLGAALGLGGLALAWLFYVARPALPGRVSAALGGFAALVREKFRIDELYDGIVVRPVFALATLGARGIDPLIDGLATGPAAVTRATSGAWRRLQTGNVQHYALSFLAGALLLVGWYVLGR